MTDAPYDRAAHQAKIAKRGYISDAGISQDGFYRYWLTRDWSPLSMAGSLYGDLQGDPTSTFSLARNVKLTWIMFNPSTADKETDDATIRRCMAFSRAWGYGGIQVVNLFAWRSTDPKAIDKQMRWSGVHGGESDPVGPVNDRFIGNAARHSAMLGFPKAVCAWGALAQGADGRVKRVMEVLKQAGAQPHCLGLTKAGHPRHPLYAPKDAKLVPYYG
jgi:hypothetical protein